MDKEKPRLMLVTPIKDHPKKVVHFMGFADGAKYKLIVQRDFLNNHDHLYVQDAKGNDLFYLHADQGGVMLFSDNPSQEAVWAIRGR